ncbi:MAG: molecular chaperone DnaK [Armatimonadota bacterium]
MSKILGIDLGTTNSVVAVMEGAEPVVIPLSDGSRLLPSVVGVSRTGERLVGHMAKRQAITHPDRTVTSIKRHMGTSYRVEIDGVSMTPQEISARILERLREDAAKYLGQDVRKAVITVPAYFSDAQRQATKDAGAIAGLEVVRIINEPTAAALAFGLDRTDAHTVLVWDLGGGTFDVSILEMGDGVFEVKATSGDTHLGGDDWDQALMEWMAAEFRNQTGVDLLADRVAAQRLKEAAEKAKIELSSVVTTAVNLPFISVNQDGPLHLDITITRAKFEEITAHLLKRMEGPTLQALKDARMEPSDLDCVLLVGGSTRMPAVRDLMRTMLGKEPLGGFNPDEVVALGAAIQGGVLAGEVREIVLLDVTPLTLGIETLGGVFTPLIERNTTIPTSRSRMFTTAADNQTTVDIHVLQGEREFASDNISLGRFQLTGIQPAPRGTPRIDVSFEIDVNGICHVSARDTATGNRQSITVKATTSLSREEVARLVREAELHRAEDARRRELQELRNRADALLYNAERTARDAEGLVSAALVQTVRDGLAALRQSLAGEDADLIRRQVEQLSADVYRLGAAYYQAKESGSAPAAEAAADGEDAQPEQTESVQQEPEAAEPPEAEPEEEPGEETER